MKLSFSRLLLGVVGLTLFASAGPLGAQGEVASSPPASAPQIGDAVRITVWQLPELSGEFEIGEDGTLLHPLYRSIRMAGLPREQAEAEVRRVLQRFETNPEFVVEPLFRVSIGGEVMLPNVYTLPQHTTVSMAVTRAGGATPAARLERARLLRDGSVILVDLRRPHSELRAIRIRSGDQIILDRRRNLWRDTINPVLVPVGSLSAILVTVLGLTGGLR